MCGQARTRARERPEVREAAVPRGAVRFPSPHRACPSSTRGNGGDTSVSPTESQAAGERASSLEQTQDVAKQRLRAGLLLKNELSAHFGAWFSSQWASKHST